MYRVLLVEDEEIIRKGIRYSVPWEECGCSVVGEAENGAAGEEKIAELEARISEIDTEMSDPAIGTQVAKLQELSKEQAACQKQLEKLYEQWEELAE